MLGSVLEKEAIKILPLGIDAGGSHSLMCPSHCKIGSGGRIVESSLLLISTKTWPRKHVGASAGTPQMKLTGWRNSPIHQQFPKDFPSELSTTFRLIPAHQRYKTQPTHSSGEGTRSEIPWSLTLPFRKPSWYSLAASSIRGQTPNAEKTRLLTASGIQPAQSRPNPDLRPRWPWPCPH